MATFKPPSLPPGKDKHHIVVLEGVHAPMPTFDFPHTIDEYPLTSPDQVAERIKDATIVINTIRPITSAHLDIAPHLGCVAIMAVGISWLDREVFAQRGITVTNCAGANVEAVSEHFLALYFGLRKKVGELDHGAKTSNEWHSNGTMTTHWPERKPPPGCNQEVLGILGYGTIGKRIAMLAKALGFKEILVADRKGAQGQTKEGRTPFEEVIRRASTIAVCVPKDNDTIDLINTEELKAMREDAILINIARGGIINEAALAKALQDGEIAGAAADVLDNEPAGPGLNPLLPDLAKGEAAVPNFIICE